MKPNEHRPSKPRVASSSLAGRVAHMASRSDIRFRMFIDDRNALGCHHWMGSTRRILEARLFALGRLDAPRYTRVIAKCGSPSCVRPEHLALGGSAR